MVLLVAHCQYHWMVVQSCLRVVQSLVNDQPAFHLQDFLILEREREERERERGKRKRERKEKERERKEKEREERERERGKRKRERKEKERDKNQEFNQVKLLPALEQSHVKQTLLLEKLRVPH